MAVNQNLFWVVSDGVNGGTCRYAKTHSTFKNRHFLRDFTFGQLLLSAKQKHSFEVPGG